MLARSSFVKTCAGRIRRTDTNDDFRLRRQRASKLVCVKRKSTSRAANDKTSRCLRPSARSSDTQRNPGFGSNTSSPSSTSASNARYNASCEPAVMITRSGLVFEIWILSRNSSHAALQTGVRSVAVLLFDDRFDRRAANHVRRWQIGLAQSEIDAAGSRAIEDLPDDTLLDPLQTFR